MLIQKHDRTNDQSEHRFGLYARLYNQIFRKKRFHLNKLILLWNFRFINEIIIEFIVHVTEMNIKYFVSQELNGFF